ncbi:GDYXXLXY protein [Leptospira selangorensis]|uniref:GDYXXLXY protein n=1 Tax=Leptospira selangorensis TaxID=2484982 RepID=A0A5F2C199_9LEPT|nr:GDYXXLXY domain-containing protein [Leptospira selangorensis]TGM11374.1 GDYXXLXY protein [Leptospira selangorensis]TGM21023.1 GDYXXLXY protein [Leptospira selangorensis]
MKKFSISVLAVFLPIIVLASVALEREFDLRNGKILILPITGYDPRDLLSGQYLRFQIDRKYSDDICQKGDYVSSSVESVVATTDGSKLTKKETCVCFDSREPSEYEIRFYSDCNELKNDITCWNYVKGECNYGNFNYPFRKYFIPEASAKELEEKLREPGAKIQLRIDENGNGLIEKIIWPEVSSQ